MITKMEDINYVTSKLLQGKMNFESPPDTHNKNKNKQKKKNKNKFKKRPEI